MSLAQEDQLTAQPVIETPRFLLRPLRKSDAGMIAHYTGDLRLARMTTSIPHPLPPGATEAFIARATDPKREEDVWAMDGEAHGGAEVMGLISLERLDGNQAEIGYWVAPPFWNTGHASEAVRALVQANPFGSATMFASVFQDNAASARVLVNCGFEYIGDAEAFSVARNSAVPTWTYLRRMD
ncbi:MULTISPECIES: GNAT family N-acetyltransferase [Roseobacteraceae]|uniref:GNAT family N-acetyltransferase n=1 Tax=Roseobacteraceae TaxID=2854170 RepID=UPI0013B7BCE9|nr:MULTISPECIES: GNAT family N-acetyltransferase [Roseobacteraceae]MCA0996420.1 GNAT family N-acetyltransferase [Alloyangia pacifica]NDV98141.1 GNAT family N-acetyltransferase [Salipiger sp. PrR002]NDW57116.1 GNAT family N-acetyltransferase [Salipiger sp. PrR004]